MKPAAALAATATLALIGLSGPARADSVRIETGLNGSYGGNGGVHVIVFNGKVCRLKNSTFGNIPGGQPQGCNYTLREAGKSFKVHTTNRGCSRRCE